MDKWIKFAVLYLGGVIVCLSQFKIVPVMHELAPFFQVSSSKLSWLMSVFSLAGLVLAIPGAAFLSRFGGKKLAVSIMVFLVIGNLLGALVAEHNFYLLLLSRIIEGISFSVTVMVGIVLISHWFPQHETGLPIGIYGTFPALGSLIAMNAFLPMMKLWGISSLWLSVAAVSVIGLVLYYWLLDAPEHVVKDTQQEKAKSSILAQAFKNKFVLTLAFSQGCMAFVLFTFIIIYPKIFIDFYQLSPESANFYASLFALFGIPFGALAGYLIDKTGKPGLITLLSFALMTLATLYTVFLQGHFTYVLQMFLLSTAISLASTSVMITVPKIVKQKELLGYSVSFVTQMYYIGNFVGAPLVLWVVETTGSWMMGIYLMTGVSLLGTLGIFYFVISSQLDKNKAV
ncbi:MFS transporter [Serratia microhaemolytica]|uniref:MFS transporter n=1 Tax=Serratia microhaemolytica TaxID=2675110 RepID=UPI00139236CE|nr:MFS transporter [Serratia microhaemolytica]